MRLPVPRQALLPRSRTRSYLAAAVAVGAAVAAAVAVAVAVAVAAAVAVGAAVSATMGAAVADTADAEAAVGSGVVGVHEAARMRAEAMRMIVFMPPSGHKRNRDTRNTQAYPREKPQGFSRRPGGADRDRTGGLLGANQSLSQLSYSPRRVIGGARTHGLRFEKAGQPYRRSATELRLPVALPRRPPAS